MFIEKLVGIIVICYDFNRGMVCMEGYSLFVLLLG